MLPSTVQKWLFLSFTQIFLLSPANHALATATSVQGRTLNSSNAEHIVIINKNGPASPAVSQVLRRLSLNESHPDITYIYNNSAFEGFAATMGSHCLNLLANMSDISIVEKATSVSRTGTIPRHQLEPRGDRSKRDGYASRSGSPWGLQRISTTTTSEFTGSASALDFTYTYSDQSLGAGVDIYVLDTGIYTNHSAFGGRAQMLWSYDNSTEDLDGHGTHVSGTAGGSVLGVASGANLFGIKALDASGGGWSSDVVAGIDVVIQRHDARSAAATNASSPDQSPFVASVLSMSLSSTGVVTSINAAVSAAVAVGVHTCIAAGNSDTDACSTSPALTGGVNGTAITVGAVDYPSSDSNTTPSRAYFSNYGSCVDIYAPGVDIISAWIGSPNMINELDGTSMATPHVTGIVACAAAANATLAGDPSAMKAWLLSMAQTVANASDTDAPSWLLANNGIQMDASQGILGFDKRHADARHSWKLAKVAN